jgi:hypothetical protein
VYVRTVFNTSDCSTIDHTVQGKDSPRGRTRKPLAGVCLAPIVLALGGVLLLAFLRHFLALLPRRLHRRGGVVDDDDDDDTRTLLLLSLLLRSML